MSTDSPAPLDLATLRRFPDVEDPTLQAHDATDTLLVAEAIARVAGGGLSGEDIVVWAERHGAVTLSLAAAGLTGMRVVQDRLAHERALGANAERLGLTGSFRHVPAGPKAAAGARLVLWQLPRSLAEVEATVACLAGVDASAVLIAGGRLKHMHLGMNRPLEAGFGPVSPQLAQRKSRLVIAQRDAGLVASPAVSASSRHRVAGTHLTLVGAAATFGGDALDPGTGFLLRTLHDAAWSPSPEDGIVVDLGCGNGTIAAWAALTWTGARVEATDDSASAVASAALTAAANGVAERVRVVRADAGDHLPDASADLVILNPPFHQGGTVHTGIATKLMRAAARLLAPGGVLLCVWNSHLRYRPRLERIVGPTRQLGRDRTFTVTASTRRG